jgi:anti-sigma regulatory factor (Ser/Thr protein kinase)
MQSLGWANGSLVAAPTSSLPAPVGGVRNWDYRYTWVRDAAFSVWALRRIGFEGEASGFLGWVLDAFEGTRSPRIMYDVTGAEVPDEREDPELEGHRRSAPVRWGNGAADQRQHDVYGEVLDCAHLWVASGGPIDARLWGRLAALADAAGDAWRQPDQGIWEVRSEGRVFSYSAAMCQVALDRAARIARGLGHRQQASHWGQAAERLRQIVLDQAWNEDLQSLCEHLGGGDSLDASLLALPLRRVVAADDPRMVATTAAIRERLSAGDGDDVVALVGLARLPRSGGPSGARRRSRRRCGHLAARPRLREADAPARPGLGRAVRRLRVRAGLNGAVLLLHRDVRIAFADGSAGHSARRCSVARARVSARLRRSTGRAVTVDVHRSTCSFEHDAFIYDSDDGYLATLVPLIDEARLAGDTVLAVVPRDNTTLLRTALGVGAGVQFIDAETWYDHPVTTIARYTAILRSQAADTRAFVIGEVQFGVAEADWAAWTRYEAALNTALHEYDTRVICPYDARALPGAVIEDARRTHPYLLTATDARRSTDYLAAEDLFPLLPPTVAVPSAPPTLDLVVDDDLGMARRSFAAAAATRGLALERVDELTLAVSEVLTNALVHGGGAARLRVWSTEDEVTCVVDDSGDGIDDPLVGYTAPRPGSPRGYGTWLARRLFERSDFRRPPTGGLSVMLSTRF